MALSYFIRSTHMSRPQETLGSTHEGTEAGDQQLAHFTGIKPDETHIDEGVVVIKIFDGVEFESLKRVVASFVGMPEKPEVVIEMSGLVDMDSSAIGKLARISQRGEGRVSIMKPTEFVTSKLDVTGLIRGGVIREIQDASELLTPETAPPTPQTPS